MASTKPDRDASSDAVHLSVLEPQLFAQLVNMSIIKKYVIMALTYAFSSAVI